MMRSKRLSVEFKKKGGNREGGKFFA
jgi:hypothetical protein